MRPTKPSSRETAASAPPSRGVPLAAALVLLLLPFAAPAVRADVNEDCLACHSDPSMTLDFEDGTSMGLTVSADVFAGSVHGGKLVCTDCHEGYDNGDHPSGATFANRRTYVLGAYEACKKCHFDTYTRTLESVHYQSLKAGREAAPVCTDCHGAHDIQDPTAKQAMMSRSCATCHPAVYATYKASVHGKGLQEGHTDAPACADCHTAHAIADPTTARFRLSSPELCIRCHGNKELMAKYGIPVEVADTYLADFHGVTASLSHPKGADGRLVVTCIDCHGVHSIESPASLPPNVMKQRVAQVCGNCHKGAAADFPAAWLSHYRPSLQHAPLVFLINLMYRIFIPFMVVGLGLQVLLHLYRSAVRR